MGFGEPKMPTVEEIAGTNEDSEEKTEEMIPDGAAIIPDKRLEAALEQGEAARAEVEDHERADELSEKIQTEGEDVSVDSNAKPESGKETESVEKSEGKDRNLDKEIAEKVTAAIEDIRQDTDLKQILEHASFRERMLISGMFAKEFVKDYAPAAVVAGTAGGGLIGFGGLIGIQIFGAAGAETAALASMYAFVGGAAALVGTSGVFLSSMLVAALTRPILRAMNTSFLNVVEKYKGMKSDAVSEDDDQQE